MQYCSLCWSFQQIRRKRTTPAVSDERHIPLPHLVTEVFLASLSPSHFGRSGHTYFFLCKVSASRIASSTSALFPGLFQKLFRLLRTHKTFPKATGEIIREFLACLLSLPTLIAT
jgi:hypothetical protein